MKQFFTLLAGVLLTATTFAQVGINTETPDASAALDIFSTTGGLLVPRMKAAQRDGITATQGLIIFCTDCAFGEGELQVKLTSSWKNTIGGDVNDPVNDPSPFAIGDTHQGGIIFYLDGSGGGLIAAPSNQPTAAVWGCYGESIGGTGSAVGTGNQNTINIEVGCTTTGTAADICANLTLGGHSDWFLPSKDELNLMWTNLADSDGDGKNTGPSDPNNLGDFAVDFYWSSTEPDSSNAWLKSFDNGSQGNATKAAKFVVRAVRAF